ncbi:hypothetical protein [Nocardia brasiliensis]|uniref:hypothetical protein n=1 Tax=Nocardia brasiliensis TaxID=37326 RepID=UPI0024581E53|nr:hypothetical protein [Nocardia brasiliensis]
MNFESKSATIELDDHIGVEYSVTIVRLPGDDWVLSRVTIVSSGGVLSGWDLQPSAARLIFNVLHGTDMMCSASGGAPEHEFDWIPEGTRNTLHRNGIHTMATLADMADAQLLDLRSMGPVRVRRLRQGIALWKEKLAREPPPNLGARPDGVTST